MSVVSLLGVNVHKNPAKFTDNYEFEITFECLETLQKGKHFLAFVVTVAFSVAFPDTNYVSHRRPRMEADLRRLRHLQRV
jgi:hypothetical protein